MKKISRILILGSSLMMPVAFTYGINFAIAADTFTADAGFPWSMPNTNYRYTITTDGSNGLVDQSNALNRGASNLNIGTNDWLDASGQQLKLSGTVTSLPSGSQAWLQIGFITRELAEYAHDNYASFMFNNAAMMTFGQSAISLSDTAGSATTIKSGIGSGTSMDYDLTIDFTTNELSGRVKETSSSTWGSLVSRGFGTPNFGSFTEDGDQIAVLVNMYVDDGGNAGTTTSFGEIDVAVVPEPSTYALGLGAVVLACAVVLRRSHKA